MLDFIKKKDVLLSYPYEDFGIFLQVLREAVSSPEVVSIKITIYRIGHGHYERLLVAPVGLKPALLHLIDEEAGKAQRGEPCGIRLKMNSITDRALIDALVRASQAGVVIHMIVRGICCLVPGISGVTDNIHVHSIVGRFLEHARVFAFGQGEKPKLYIASADWMTRNTENRVEVAAPVENPELRQQILDMMALQFSDTRKGRAIGPDGACHVITPDTGVNAQEELMKRAHQRAKVS